MGNYVKTNGGYDVKIPSSGQVNLNTVLSALGTAGFAGINLRNLVGGLFNQGTFNGMDLNAILGMLIPMLTQMGCNCQPTCSEDHLVTRYELETEQKLAAKDAEIALLKATLNTMIKPYLHKFLGAMSDEEVERIAMEYAVAFKQQASERGYVNLFGVQLGESAFVGLEEILTSKLR